MLKVNGKCLLFGDFNSDVAKAVIKMKVCMEGLHMV